MASGSNAVKLIPKVANWGSDRSIHVPPSHSTLTPLYRNRLARRILVGVNNAAEFLISLVLAYLMIHEEAHRVLAWLDTRYCP